MVMEGKGAFCKEETFLLLLSQILECCAVGGSAAAEGEEARLTADLCAWLDDHCTGHVSLEELSRMAGRSKYSLIRAFTRERGITPYSYLMAARVGEAKRLLEAGTAPGGSRPGGGIFRPEPFDQSVQAAHWPDAGTVCRHLPGEGWGA